MVFAIATIVAAKVAFGSIGVSVVVDTTAPRTPFEHVWKRSFGSGHAKLTNRPDWQAHLAQAVTDLGLTGVRYHGLFDDDMGVVTGYRTYDWTKADTAWDYQVKQGVTPIVELSFMPAVLANCSWAPPGGGSAVNPGHAPCQRTTMAYHGITQPPAVWDDWAHLVGALATHLVERYTLGAVRTWRFEVWNELWGMPFPSDYMQLFNASAIALKAVDSSLRIGGPATMQLINAAEFVTACQTAEPPIPFDFVSTHMYPTDPQCPQKGNWGPDCLPSKVKELRAKIDTKIPLLITEYNVGCCLNYQQHDTSGAAAFAFRTIPQLVGVVDVLSWWTFSDVFEEGGLPDKEFKNIYGLMTYHGIPKPGWRGFELLNKYAGDTRLNVTISHASATDALSFSSGATLSTAPLPCYIENGTDLAGFDILPDNEHVPAVSAEACCKLCRTYNATATACSFWTWKNDGSRCYLKTSDAGRVNPAHGYTSGSIAPPPPPPPPSELVSAFATAKSGNGASTQVFLGFWVNGGAASNMENRSVAVEVNVAAVEVDDIISSTDAAPAVTAYIIDATHANPLAAWEAMGSPAVPSAAQIKTLIEVSKVVPTTVEAGAWQLSADGATASRNVTVLMVPNSAILLDFAA